MKYYYRIRLGKKSIYADVCHEGNFIGVGFIEDVDFTGRLQEDWKDFNKEFVPLYLKKHPNASRIKAGLSCGALYTVTKAIQKGDIILCPNDLDSYYVGEVVDNYSYHPNEILPHRRSVQWYSNKIAKNEISVALKNSMGSQSTACNISKYSDEIENLLVGKVPTKLILTDENVEDASIFALEEHLEEFLIANWNNTELGKNYDIYEEDNEQVGQQYETDTGRIDILAISKNKKELLVVELKKGRASDKVVGQIMRYMGFVKEELAEKDQIVKGVIIAKDDDIGIKRALSVVNNIEFYKYQVSFKLFKS